MTKWVGEDPGYSLREFRDDNLLTNPVTPENAQHLSGAGMTGNAGVAAYAPPTNIKGFCRQTG
jgi:hypothetical protein